MTALGSSRRRRTKRFMLTPLVDVIFLLLTFFMLSSRIAPFSPMSFGKPPTPAAGNAPVTEQKAASRPADLLLVLSRGVAEVNGRATPIDRLADALKPLRAAGASSAIVMTRASATVQDVVTVMEIAKRLHFASVVIRRRGG